MVELVGDIENNDGDIDIVLTDLKEVFDNDGTFKNEDQKMWIYQCIWN